MFQLIFIPGKKSIPLAKGSFDVGRQCNSRVSFNPIMITCNKVEVVVGTFKNMLCMCKGMSITTFASQDIQILEISGPMADKRPEV